MAQYGLNDVDYAYEINFEDYYRRRFKLEYDKDERKWRPPVYYVGDIYGNFVWDIEPCRAMREKKQLGELFRIREQRVFQRRSESDDVKVYVGNDIECSSFVVIYPDKTSQIK